MVTLWNFCPSEPSLSQIEALTRPMRMVWIGAGLAAVGLELRADCREEEFI